MLVFSYDDECGAYFVKAEKFNLLACSLSLKTAVAEINGLAEDLWEMFASEDDDRLETGGKKLKENLREYLEEKE